MVKIQRLPNGQLVITLPKKIAELLGWEKGIELVFKLHGRDSLILEKKNIPEGKNEKS